MKMRLQLLILCIFTAALMIFNTIYRRYNPNERNNVDLVHNRPRPSTKQEKQETNFKEPQGFHSPGNLRQNQRKQLVELFCRKTGLNTMPDPFHIAVIQPLRILYCVTPKVASRQWRQMLYRFAKGAGEIRLNRFSPNEQKQMLETYFKFTYVREPFERILSAYKDKFQYPRTTKGNRDILQLHGTDILKSFRPGVTKRALTEVNDITFAEFIEYLVTKGSNKTTPVMDWHWDNYVNICGMCAVSYDFIGHYETFNQDLSDFKQAAGLSPKQAKLFNAYAKNKSDTAAVMLDYYSQISLEWITTLGQIFRANFEMFGYGFPGPLASLFVKSEGQ